MSDLECALTAERTRRISDAEEWKQFQADLLMTVRVANDFQVNISRCSGGSGVEPVPNFFRRSRAVAV